MHLADFPVQDCMTFSIGFRAPSSKELLTFFGEHAASVVAKPDDLYKDPDLRKQDNPGELVKLQMLCLLYTSCGSGVTMVGRRHILCPQELPENRSIGGARQYRKNFSVVW